MIQNYITRAKCILDAYVLWVMLRNRKERRDFVKGKENWLGALVGNFCFRDQDGRIYTELLYYYYY